jgi:hypothetical protein
VNWRRVISIFTTLNSTGALQEFNLPVLWLNRKFENFCSKDQHAKSLLGGDFHHFFSGLNLLKAEVLDFPSGINYTKKKTDTKN